MREGIRNGQCHIISLSPVRDAMGAKWDKNRPLVEDFHIQGSHRAVVSQDDLTARTHGIIATRRLLHARELLSALPDSQLAFCVPLSLDAFAHSSSRIAIMHKLRRLSDNPHTSGRLFVEIADLPCNVSVSRVAEAVAQVKGFVRRVSVRLPADCRHGPDWTQAGADGLILPVDHPLPDHQLRQQLQALHQQARRCGAFAAVDGLSTPAAVVLAHACGAHEIGGDQITHAFGSRCETRALPFTEIMRAVQAA